MGGDEITAEWLGNTYSLRLTTTNTPQRFSNTHKRFRTVKIDNNNNIDTLYVGKYYSDNIEFLQQASIMGRESSLKFEFLDLYELGYRTGTGVVVLKVLCINNY